jgi:hypothetical protein
MAARNSPALDAPIRNEFISNSRQTARLVFKFLDLRDLTTT